MKSFSDRYESITLHMGAHRTGTSSLQACLHLADEALAANHIDLMAPPVFGLRDVANHRPFLNRAMRLAGKIERGGLIARTVFSFQYDRAIDRLFDHSARNGKPGNSLLVSEENMLARAVLRENPATLYPLAGERLKQLAALFGSNVNSVFLAIRPYPDFLLSYLAMANVYGDVKIGFEELEQWLEGPFGGWPTLVDAIETNFPGTKIQIWPHEAFHLENRFVALTSLANTAFPNQRSIPGSNPSPTVEAIEAIRLAKKSGPLTRKARDEIVTEYQSGRAIRVEDYLSQKSVKMLELQYRSDLKELEHLISR
jgi:hypothetical protein